MNPLVKWQGLVIAGEFHSLVLVNSQRGDRNVRQCTYTILVSSKLIVICDDFISWWERVVGQRKPYDHSRAF